MKNLFLFSILSLSLVFSVQTFAQDFLATSIVDKLIKKIQESQGIEADFVLYLSNDKNKKYPVSGELLIKGNSYAVKMKNHKIFCDGVTVINYLVDNKEVQLSRYNKNDIMMSPSLLFSSSLKDNFSYKHISVDRVSGKKVNVLEFIPKKVNKFVTHMHLYVNDSNEIVGGKVFDNKGSYYYYEIIRINMDAKLRPAQFTIHLKDLNGIEVIDLR